MKLNDSRRGSVAKSIVRRGIGSGRRLVAAATRSNLPPVALLLQALKAVNSRRTSPAEVRLALLEGHGSRRSVLVRAG